MENDPSSGTEKLRGCPDRAITLTSDDFRLVADSDRGSQYTSAACAQVLDAHHVLASVGAVACAYDNALAESVDNLKTEPIAERCGAPAASSSSPSSGTSATNPVSVKPGPTQLELRDARLRDAKLGQQFCGARRAARARARRPTPKRPSTSPVAAAATRGFTITAGECATALRK